MTTSSNCSHNAINRLLGGRFKFESKNYSNEFWRHKNGDLLRESQESSQLYDLDTSFDVVPGLYGIGVSFRSVNYPNRFIRHCNSLCSIDKYMEYSHAGDPDLFKKDASWIPREGIADPKGVSFESVNYPREFMRHSSGKIRKDQYNTTNLFGDDATWYPRLMKPPRVVGEWKLVYANDNAAASGQFTDSVVVGTDFIENSTNVGFSWKSILQRSHGANVPILEGFPLMSASVKDVFEFGMSSSVANLDPSTWSMTVTQEPKKYSISLKAGEPVYLWKWHVAAMTSDSTYMVAKTSIYMETTTHQSPPPYIVNWP